MPQALIHCKGSVCRIIGIAVFLSLAAPAAADALREAAEALERDDYAAAIPHLESALESEPDNVNARFNLAFACQSTGDHAGAIRHYRLIAAQQPELLPARRNLAGLLMRSGEFGEAAAEYEAISGAQPGDTQVLRLLAAAHAQAGNPGGAAGAFEQILEIEGESAETLVDLARTLDAAGRLHEAVPRYIRAAGIDPRFAELLPGIAARLDEAGARHDATELYRRVARLRPDDAAAQEEVGIRLLEEGNVRSSTPALERSVAIEPTAERHAALAEAYRRAGKPDLAYDQLRLAAGAAPGDPDKRVRHANALLQRREFELAAREYLAACETDPKHLDGWNGLAFAMFQLGNFQASLRAIQEAEKLGPAAAATAYLKALAWDRLQQYEQAAEAYRVFLAMRPDMEDETWKAEQRLKTIGKVLSKR